MDQEYNISPGNGMKVMCLVPRLVAGLPRIASALTRVTNCSADISNTGVSRKWLLKQK
jgi:hypothetical protein